MPDSRDDVLRLLTKLDRIPGQCRHSLKELLLELPPLPKDFRVSLLLSCCTRLTVACEH